MNEDLALVAHWAREAGRLALEVRARGLNTRWKAGHTPLTDGDVAVDALLKRELLAARPDHGWLSEETADDPARLSKFRLFIVDPIDGTLAYVNGKPWFTVCIAVVEDGRPACGAVYAPELDELYLAAAGEGATLNGQPIGVTDRASLEDASLLADKTLLARPEWERPWPTMRVESRNSVAYRVALTAAGAFDGVFAPNPKQEWDLAAADLIVTEAGGVITDHKGRTFTYNRPTPRLPALVCAGPVLHSLLLERVSHLDLGD